MIRESVIDPTLDRLSTAFGNRLVVRPPACAEDIATLEHLVDPLPREFSIFLLTCNGLRVHVNTPRGGDEWHLWHTQEMAASILSPQGPGMPPFLVPFRGDPTTTRDCLITGHGPAEGAVIRWDPWGRDVELLASGFGRYLDRWARYMIENFGQDRQDRNAVRPLFDAAYTGAGDDKLAALRKNAAVADWLNELDYVVASGDDFE
jgi:hypothetical protein